MCIYCRQTPCVTTDSRPWVVRLPTALSWELLFPKERFPVFNLKSVELCPKGGSKRKLIVFQSTAWSYVFSKVSMHWLWLRVHRLVILQARWQILSWFWTACNFCSLDRTTTKMMSNRQPMRIRREQRGFALPAIPAGKHSFIGLLKIIFFFGFEYKLMVIFFSFCRDRRTCGNTKWCRPQPVFSSDRHWGRENTSFPKYR